MDKRKLSRMRWLTAERIREMGQGLVEYALILMLVAIVVIVIVALFGGAVGNLDSVTINTI